MKRLFIVMIISIAFFACDLNGNNNPVELELLGNIGLSSPNLFTLRVGDTITVHTDRLGGTGNIVFKWFRGNGNILIPQANTSTFTLTDNEIGQIVRVEVSRTGYTGTRGWQSIHPILPSNAPELTGTISVDGLLRVGQTLNANINNLNGTGLVHYRWFRETDTGWSTVGGGFSTVNNTFLLTSEYVGRRIMLEVLRLGYYRVISYTTDLIQF